LQHAADERFLPGGCPNCTKVTCDGLLGWCNTPSTPGEFSTCWSDMELLPSVAPAPALDGLVRQPLQSTCAEESSLARCRHILRLRKYE
jgi:hypothetical protein